MTKSQPLDLERGRVRAIESRRAQGLTDFVADPLVFARQRDRLARIAQATHSNCSRSGEKRRPLPAGVKTSRST